MKAKLALPKKTFTPIAFLVICSGIAKSSAAQCDGKLYGLGNNGIIYSINTTTAAATALSSATDPNNPISANGLGYNGSTFYYFSKNTGGTNGANNLFESFTKAGGYSLPLSNSGSPSGSVNSGCISPDGKGFYCIDANGYLYRYDIAGNSWSTITQHFIDQTSNTDITSTIASNSSGDIAFDGNGNLWILLSNTAGNKYGLYKLSNTPAVSVASVKVSSIIPLSNTSGFLGGSGPVGIAFDASGIMYIATLSRSTFTYDLYSWSTLSSNPQHIGTLSQPILDLTSCSTPLGVLPVHFTEVTVTATSKADVAISWKVAQEKNTHLYQVERSTDGLHWESISSQLSNAIVGAQTYSYVDKHPDNGTFYYRISETDWDGKVFYSEAKSLTIRNNLAVRSWPNPAREILFVQNNRPEVVKARIFDNSGRTIQEKLLQPGTNQVSLNALHAGTYMLLVQQTGSPFSYSFIKE